MTSYHFVTVWKYATPVEKIWPIIIDVEKWPSWWKGVRNVQLLQRGDAHGTGARQHCTWRSQLPYNIEFDAHVTKIIPFSEIAGEANGDLVGQDVWKISQEGAMSQIQYNWYITPQKHG